MAGSFDATVFEGYYEDPKHHMCPRRITISDSAVSVKGHDEKNVDWEMKGRVAGETIVVDFSPKGGPQDIVGKWEGDGIRWPDDNKWEKKKDPGTFNPKCFEGYYEDPFHHMCPRRITVSDDAKVSVKGHDEKKVDWEMTGEVVGHSIVVDFSPKGGPKNIMGKHDEDGVRWPDGNKWEKKKDPGTFNPKCFEGYYEDPFHHMCPRRITVSDDAKVSVKGHDEKKVDWEMTGEVVGHSIVVDFSPKGGPKNIMGKHVEDGVRWPDGNTWEKKKDPHCG
ncbi:hypothetical protein DIPPA_13331 [Diplonema papillatum]|nr:hypothetical protein DIPPA_13331 [Diplonema papillatum]